jgi:hypothetical protein
MFIAQQRVEPDQAPAGLVQAFHLALQPFARVPVQAIGNE